MLHPERLIELHKFAGFAHSRPVDASEIFAITPDSYFCGYVKFYEVCIELRRGGGSCSFGGEIRSIGLLSEQEANDIAEQITAIWKQVLAKEGV
ncbi:MAG TPA: hypothetical protein VLB83_03015 [Candidatus Paceibacterota bacterium]|nr:hypothetical protein [Candidatus Paceibacterota bacterium]